MADRTYPLTRSIYWALYRAPGKPLEPVGRGYLRYIFSRQGQEDVAREGDYLPLTPGFFSILVGLFVIVLLLIQLGVLRYAYMRLGMSSGAALLLLFASLVGGLPPIIEVSFEGQLADLGREFDHMAERIAALAQGLRIIGPQCKRPIIACDRLIEPAGVHAGHEVAF